MTLFDAKIYQNRRICVAFSGGMDSVCLLHALKEQAKTYALILSAVHIEHGIRGEESLRDMNFCRDLCKKWGIPLQIERFDVPKLAGERGGSLEQNARAVRYQVFQMILDKGQADLVATAHHMDDVAETILFRLARGTGLSGMKAITEYGGIVRPLLGVTRQEIATYVAKNGLPHVEDSTNADENYTRNYIRHSVLSAFEKIHQGAESHLVEFAALAAEEDEFLQTMAKDSIVHVLGEEHVPVDLPDVLFRRACLICMRQSGENGDLRRANVAEIEKLKNLQSGRKVAVPLADGKGKLYAIREGKEIVFDREQDVAEEVCPFVAKKSSYLSPASFSVRECGTDEPQMTGERRLFVDLDAFPKGCVVRFRREGDVITPYHAPRVPLKKFLTNRKIPARLSHKLPVIANGNEILAVVGVEISDLVKVTEKTVRKGIIE